MEDDEIVAFQSFEDAHQAILRDRESLILMCFGVHWAYAAKKNAQNVLTFLESPEAVVKKGNLVKGFRTFIVNSEKCREYCTKNGIVVGIPVLQAHFRGKTLMFQRGESEPVDKIKGIINLEQLSSIQKKAVSVVEAGGTLINWS